MFRCHGFWQCLHLPQGYCSDDLKHKKNYPNSLFYRNHHALCHIFIGPLPELFFVVINGFPFLPLMFVTNPLF